jgi:hypothetical protein
MPDFAWMMLSIDEAQSRQPVYRWNTIPVCSVLILLEGCTAFEEWSMMQ